ncbi:MAG: hypothetical protein OIF50_17360, partial [Flavobacteriaceae bacterium]|nr:hypothetical protein [Flavobacteriaceae bacterium]
KFGKLQYRLAINDALTNTLETNSVNSLDDLSIGQTAYVGKKLLGSKEAGFAYAGYFEYQLWDQESNFVPFKVGTYLGKKKILNIGAGFFLHPNGSVNRVDSNTFEGQNVSLLAADIFMETPVGENGAALTAYAVLQANNYGKNYMLGTTYGTGTMIYTHVGYLLPGDMNKGRWQPYISFQNHSYDAHGDNQNRLGIGTNYYISGNNAKLSIEYTNSSGISEGNMLTLQAMIYL